MNEGIIKNLRLAADNWEKNHNVIGVGELRVHEALRDAARCIEETTAKIPAWISVKDRLPKNEDTVLISAIRKGCDGVQWCTVMTAFYTDGTLHTEDSSYSWELGSVEIEYCEETDDYIIPEGWWEDVQCGDEFSAVDLFVTHWMPLPPAPTD